MFPEIGFLAMYATIHYTVNCAFLTGKIKKKGIDGKRISEWTQI
jgi:hypothetical protein